MNKGHEVLTWRRKEKLVAASLMLSLRPIYCELLPQGFLLIENNGKRNDDYVATPA